MDKYETFNPDIDLTYGDETDSSLTYGEQRPASSASSQKTASRSHPAKPGKSTGGQRKRATRNAAKSIRTPDTSKINIPSLSTIFSKIKDFFAAPRTRWTIGLAALLLGAYLAIAFVSYVYSGFKDQSAVTGKGVGQAGVMHNMGGEGGARLSELLINDSFGLAAAVIVVWLFGIAFKQIGVIRFKTVNFTIKCLVALITTSLIVGLLTIGLDSHFLWGGAHGYLVNQTIIQFIGWYGAALLSLLLLALFFMICLYDIYKYFMAIHRRRKAERLALEEEEERQRLIAEKIARMQALEDERDATEEDTQAPAQEEGMVFTPGDADLSHISAESNDDPEPDDSEVFDQDGPTEESSLHLNNTPPEDTEAVHGKTDIALPGEEAVMEVTVGEISQADPASIAAKAAALVEQQGEYDPRADLSRYQFPPTSLLAPARSTINVDEQEQLENQEKIRTTLADFGIGITDIKATVGPTVTLYEIKPDSGVRINKIRSLGDDIALSLAAIGVRIIAPIPGKGTVGIEVANKSPQTVSMRTILESRKYLECKYDLPLAIGSTINNQVYIADLAKMPHLLVAGATGQGKSVGLNAMIASLLYSKHPSELKFVLIDPKMVEFSLYNSIADNYLAKLEDEEEAVITRMDKVVSTLCSLCVEMDNRFELLKAAGVKNIQEYNSMFRSRRLNPEKGHKFMPFIVVIVDEFADLIMQVGKEAEAPIARLAQKARAIGIHVILATQRPSANVITGVIKANFPARIAFKVSSGIDSKTILDATGAQQLIGRGDMLISAGPEVERVQCAFIDTPEVTAISEYIASQPHYPHPLILPPPPLGTDGDSDYAGSDALADRDPLFEECARLVVTAGTASTSSLQRRYSIGYNRAGKIMDQLEAAGIVGPSQGGKPRQVLVDMMGLDSMLASL